ncbi:DUF6526 family protein [Virgibacillus oceani]
MKVQTFSYHTQSVPGFHYFLVPLCFVTLLASVANGVVSIIRGETIIVPVLLISLALIATITVFFLRSFVCKVQDRVIRTEENFRYFVLTGKLLESRLTIGQIIALRFAPDDEFPDLCEKAFQKNMSPDDIKRSIQKWKADNYRV